MMLLPGAGGSSSVGAGEPAVVRCVHSELRPPRAVKTPEQYGVDEPVSVTTASMVVVAGRLPTPSSTCAPAKRTAGRPPALPFATYVGCLAAAGCEASCFWPEPSAHEASGAPSATPEMADASSHTERPLAGGAETGAATAADVGADVTLSTMKLQPPQRPPWNMCTTAPVGLE